MKMKKQYCFTHSTGEDIYLFALNNVNGTEVNITNYGAIITSLKINNINMSKEIKCNKCNRDLFSVGRGCEIVSEKLNPNPKDSSNKELLIKVFDIKLCEDCYEQEKDKYLNDKREYSI